MKENVRKYLFDAKIALDRIELFTNDYSLEQFVLDFEKQYAVERAFILIGEALNRVDYHEPEIGKQIKNLPKIIAFRNIIAHEYERVDEVLIWNTIQRYLPELRKDINELLRL